MAGLMVQILASFALVSPEAAFAAGGDGLFPAFSNQNLLQSVDVKTTYRCEKYPKPKRSLETASKYDVDDDSRSEIDPDREAAYDKEMEALNEFSQGVVKAANAWVRSGMRNREAAECAADWLIGWADKKAVTEMNSLQAYQARESRLAAMALAYAQIRDSGVLDAKERKTVTGWLRGMAYQTVGFYESRPHTVSYQNNHRYWAGLAAAATGYAIDDRALREWGYQAYRAGVRQIDMDGFLPLELERASRAFEYHLYAAAPLVMLAEIGQTDGLDLYAEENGALHRLTAQIRRSIKDPHETENRAGAKQIQYKTENGLVPSYKMGWLEPYHYRFRKAEDFRLAETFRPIKSSGLGGDLTLLFTAEEN